MNKGLPQHIQAIVETLCETGCQRVNEIIETLGKGGDVKKTAALTEQERKQVLTNLRILCRYMTRKKSRKKLLPQRSQSTQRKSFYMLGCGKNAQPTYMRIARINNHWFFLCVLCDLCGKAFHISSFGRRQFQHRTQTTH